MTELTISANQSVKRPNCREVKHFEICRLGRGGALRWWDGGGRDNDAVFDPDFVSEIKGTQGLTSYVWSDIAFTISPTLGNEMVNSRLN